MRPVAKHGNRVLRVHVRIRRIIHRQRTVRVLERLRQARQARLERQPQPVVPVHVPQMHREQARRVRRRIQAVRLVIRRRIANRQQAPVRSRVIYVLLRRAAHRPAAQLDVPFRVVPVVAVLEIVLETPRRRPRPLQPDVIETHDKYCIP